MQAIVLNGLDDLAVADVPEQEVGPSDVKVKVAYNGICGSDKHIVDGNLGAASTYPIIMGHEMSGTIVELGEKAKIRGLKAGDRIAGSPSYYCGACDMCRSGKESFCEQFLSHIPPGSMAEYVVWNEQQIYKLPEGMPMDEGAFLEPVSAAMRGIENANIKLGGTVAILGMGPIGLIQVQLARLGGASKILVSDVVPEKLELAKQFGADVAVNANEDSALDVGMEVTEDAGFDSVIDATGIPAVVEEGFYMVSRGGTLNCFAVYPMDYFFPFHLATGYLKEITIKSTFFSPYLFPRAVAMLPYLRLKPLISKTFDLKDGLAAFEADKDNSNIKIMIKS